VTAGSSGPPDRETGAPRAAQHRICAECAAVREDCFLAETQAEADSPIETKNSALEVKLLSVKGISDHSSEDQSDEPANCAQLKVLLMFADVTKCSNLSSRAKDDIDGNNVITWNETFQFGLDKAADDSTEVFVELLNGDEDEQEHVVVTSRKQRLLKHSVHGHASVHLDSLASARKLQSGAPISLDLPLLGGIHSGGSLKIVVRITNPEHDDSDASSVASSVETNVSGEGGEQLTREVSDALNGNNSDLDSVVSDGSRIAVVDKIAAEPETDEDEDEGRAARLTDKAESFKVLAEAAHSLEDNLSKAQEVDAMIRKLQYSIISDEEPDDLTKVESDACVELSRALTGKSTPAPGGGAAAPAVGEQREGTPARLSMENEQGGGDGEGGGSDESSSDEESSDEESSDEESSDDDEDDDEDKSEVISPFEPAHPMRRSPITLLHDTETAPTAGTEDPPTIGNRPSDVVMLGTQATTPSTARKAKPQVTSPLAEATSQYAPPKVFIEKTKSYKKVSSRLMNPTRASQGSRWDKPVAHPESSGGGGSSSSQHPREEHPTKKSAFRQTSEMYEKKGDKLVTASKTPHQKAPSGNESFEPSEYNNVSKFQLVQSRLMEPTKAFLESRRGGKASATPGKEAAPGKFSAKRHASPKPGRSPRSREPQVVDIENDYSSLREESVTSSLSALTDTDSHVSPLEHPGATIASSNHHSAAPGSHYAPPIIAKHGITSYNHVQVSNMLYSHRICIKYTSILYYL
jgi:hypothetical protein